MKTKNFMLIAASVAMICYGPAAYASLSIVSLSGGGPKPFSNYVNFDSLALGGGINITAPNTADSANPLGSIKVSFSPDAQIVRYAASGLYAAPFLSGSNGADFGQGAFIGPDETKYITSGSFGTVSNSAATLTFSSPQKYLGLLWGSVDNYNTLKFYSGSNESDLVGTITGSQIAGSPIGNQGVEGTFYVNIDSTLSFVRVVATSSQYAFEFDNVAYSETPAAAQADVPEPTSLIVWSLVSLASCGGTWWRRRKLAA